MSRPFLYWLLVALLVLASGLMLRATLSMAVPYEPNSDEGYYLRMAAVLETEGLSAYPRLFEAWNRDTANWIYPSPLRVGHLLMLAGLLEVLPASLETLSWLSVASQLGWVLVCAWFARRLLPEGFALCLTLLLATAPLLLGSARLALQDSHLLFWLGLAIWSFLDCVRDPSQRGMRVVFALSFAMSVLVKETSALMGPVFLALLAWQRWVRREPLPVLSLGLLVVLPALLVLPTLLIAAGGLEPLLATARTVLGSPATDEYAIRYGSGPWYRYLVDYLLISPWTTLAACAGLGARLSGKRFEFGDRELTLLALLGCLLLVEMSFFTKNARYLLILELPLRALALAWIFGLAGGARRTVLVAGFVLLVVVSDLSSFEYGWVRHKIYDPLTGTLMQLRGLLPR